MAPQQRSMLFSLPTELLKIIAQMAYDQDEALRARKRRLERKLSKARLEHPKAVALLVDLTVSIKQLSATSVLGLHGTCRVLRGVARPFVFQEVTMRQAMKSYFFDHIVIEPSYIALIKTIELWRYVPIGTTNGGIDCEAYLEGFLQQSIFFGNLREVIFSDVAAVTFFNLRDPNGAYTDLYAVQDATISDAFQLAAVGLYSSLRKRITSLHCRQEFSDILCHTLDLFPNLTHFAASVTDEGVLIALATMPHLESLELGPWNDDRDDPWQINPWCSNVSRLRVTAAFVPALWPFINIFAKSLKQLELVEYLKVTTGQWTDLPPPVQPFANLNTLHYHGSLSSCVPALTLLQTSPIRHLSLKTDDEDFFRGSDIPSDLKYFRHLETISVRLIDGYGEYSVPFNYIPAHCLPEHVRFVPDEGPLFEHPIFRQVKPIDPSASPQVAQYPSFDDSLTSSRALIGLASKRLDEAEKERDVGKLNEINRLLRALGAQWVADNE